MFALRDQPWSCFYVPAGISLSVLGYWYDVWGIGFGQQPALRNETSTCYVHMSSEWSNIPADRVLASGSSCFVSFEMGNYTTRWDAIGLAPCMRNMPGNWRCKQYCISKCWSAARFTFWLFFAKKNPKKTPNPTTTNKKQTNNIVISFT